MTPLKLLIASDLAQGVATSRQRKQVLYTAAISGVVGAAVFLTSPYIDIAITKALFLGSSHFIFTGSELAAAIRLMFKGLFFAALALSVVGLLISVCFSRDLLRLGIRKWNFLFACLVLGPGFVANLLFKEHWGRARPRDIEQFGGNDLFTPALMFSEACDTNCSFVSGEAAAIFMLFFALALLTRQHNFGLLAAGILAGMVVGFIRMGQGGHFFSDIIFSAIFMAMLAGLIHWLAFGKHTSRAGNKN